jgi:hypothetical protein
MSDQKNFFENLHYSEQTAIVKLLCNIYINVDYNETIGCYNGKIKLCLESEDLDAILKFIHCHQGKL